MVIKTEVCSFSGIKIYPGKGRRLIKMDCKSFTFFSRKEISLFSHKKNPRKLTWTQFFRKLHKKGTSAEQVTKRKVRKTATTAMSRGIVGASVEMIKAKRDEPVQRRAALRDAAIRAVKEKKKTDAASKDKKAAAAKAAPKVAAAKTVSKQAPKGGAGSKPVAGGKGKGGSR